MVSTPSLFPGGTSRFPQTPSTGPLRGRTLRVSFLKPQISLADTHDVTLGQSPWMLEPHPVEVGAVRRAEVLHPDPVLPRLEAGVARRRVLVGSDRDVVLAAAPDRQLRRVELEVLTLVEVRALEDDEAARVRSPAARLHARVRRGGEDEALLRQAQVTARSPDDPPDEEIEQDEERDLEDEEDFVHRGRVEDHLSDSREKVSSVEPSVMVSPLLSFARFTRLPLTSSPFVEPRSTSQ